MKLAWNYLVILVKWNFVIFNERFYYLIIINFNQNDVYLNDVIFNVKMCK